MWGSDECRPPYHQPPNKFGELNFDRCCWVKHLLCIGFSIQALLLLCFTFALLFIFGDSAG